MAARARGARRRFAAAQLANQQRSGAPASPIAAPADLAPYHAEDESSHHLIIPLGLDPERDHLWSLMVSLGAPQAGQAELLFCLIESDGAGAATEHFDGRTTAARFTAEERDAIRFMLMEAVLWLVCKARPERIYWCTREPTPPKALAKFVLMARTIESCGYRISRPNIWHGRHAWWADRLNVTLH